MTTQHTSGVPYIPENLKLTQNEAQALLIQVGEKRAALLPSYRLGQAIYNAMGDSLARIVWNTELDMFYWTDDNLVMETFYKHFVRG